MTNILLGCLLIGAIAVLAAWKVKSIRMRIAIGVGLAVLLVAGFLLALVLGGDS